jgi:hypothetical protein
METLISVWVAFVSWLGLFDWASIAAFSGATGALGLVGIAWSSRASWAARWPWVGAAFELAEVFGFSPSALQAWVAKRAWYRKGESEAARLRRLNSSLCLVLVCSSCASLPSEVCGVPTDRALPAALSLARAVIATTEALCGSACPVELRSVSDSLNKAEAARPQVCQAVEVARPLCAACSERLDTLSLLASCETLSNVPPSGQ